MSNYSAIILAESSLVSYWQLGDSTTTATDSKDSNPGTYSGSYTQSVTGIPGAGGTTAVNFNTTGKVAAGNPTNLQLSAPLTLEAWVKAPIGDNDPIVVKYDGGSGFHGYGMRYGGTTTLHLDFWCGGAWFTSTGTMAINTYHHVVCTLSGTTATMYIDGAQDKQGTVSVSLSTTAAIAIGHNNTGDNSNAIIGQVAIYNTALSGASVLAHYNAGIAAPTFTLTGPTSGVAGVASTNFTLTPSMLIGGDTVTIGLSGAPAGSTTPSSLVFTGVATPLTFTYTPAHGGVETLTLTSGGGYTITNSPWTYTVTGGTTGACLLPAM